ncbi:MAG: hypothetical protein ACXWQO_08990 [Bdellovibrionota bacterium]
MAAQLREKPVFWGFLGIGFISLFGGIIMAGQVAREMKADKSDIPPEMGMIFIDVFTGENLLFSERSKYAAALNEVGVNQDKCREYNCLLTLAPDSLNYKFQMSVDGRTWFIQAKSPVPVEEKK